jgi:6-phosphogluconolactonase
MRTRIVPDPETLAREASRLFVETVAEAVSRRGRAFVALAGGLTPRRAYEVLAEEGKARVPWERVLLVAGDERNVPREDPDRNERMIRESLLDRVPAARDRLLEWEAGELPPGEVALRMEEALRAAFEAEAGAIPRFDLVLLGVGADGHTASLFPGTAALEERDRLAVANPVPPTGGVRYTLTFPVFEAARRVVFLVAGAEKAGVVRRILDQGERSGFPAARARARDGETLWLLDRAAAGEGTPG